MYVAPGATVILLGNYRPALTVARVLSAKGYQVEVSCDHDGAAARWSCAVDGIWNNPDSSDPAVLYAALSNYLASNPQITTVFPLMERYVRNFYTYAHLLPQDRLYVMPNKLAVDICMDKPRLLDVATRAGLKCARSVEVTNHEALLSAAAHVGYPLVVKPSDSTIWLGARKALILADQGALTHALPEWPDAHETLIVQRFVDGPRVNLYFAAAGGRAIRYLAVRIERTDITDGTGLATTGDTIELDPALKAMADTLLDHLHYHGVGCIQVLMERATGQPSFLEINPRIGGNHAITTQCGLDMDTLALDLARQEPLDTTLRIGHAGKRYVWTTGDLHGLGRALRNKEASVVKTLIRSAGATWRGLITRRHVTWKLTDPMPSLVLLSRLIPGIRF